MSKFRISILAFFCIVNLPEVRANSSCDLNESSRVDDLLQCVQYLSTELEETKSRASFQLNQIAKLQLQMTASKIRPTIPANAVIAVDDIDGCPAGWDPFFDANGRVIVGASVERSKAEALQRYYRELDGSAFHSLSANELPVHSHNYTDMGVGYKAQPKYEGLDTEFRGSSNVSLYHGQSKTQSAGRGKPFDKMPPFIALYFCKKSKLTNLQ